MKKLRKIKLVALILILIAALSSFTSSATIFDYFSYAKEAEDTHENIYTEICDKYGNVLYYTWSWDDTNDHPSLYYFEPVSYSIWSGYYEGDLDKYDWSHDYQGVTYSPDGGYILQDYYTGYYRGTVFLYEG